MVAVQRAMSKFSSSSSCDGQGKCTRGTAPEATSSERKALKKCQLWEHGSGGIGAHRERAQGVESRVLEPMKGTLVQGPPPSPHRKADTQWGELSLFATCGPWVCSYHQIFFFFFYLWFLWSVGVSRSPW